MFCVDQREVVGAAVELVGVFELRFGLVFGRNWERGSV